MIKYPYSSVSEPAWFDADHTMIAATVVFEHLKNIPVRFVASAKDGEAHGREIYEDIVAGKYGPIAESVTG